MKRLNGLLMVMAALALAQTASNATADGGDEDAGGLGEPSTNEGSALSTPYYLLEGGGEQAPSCFQNRQLPVGKPTICLYMRHPAENPSANWEVQVCKDSLSGVFQNPIAWEVTDEFRQVESGVATTLPGTPCTEWEPINLSSLPCGTTVLQAELDSPAVGEKPVGRYYSGGLKIFKGCI